MIRFWLVVPLLTAGAVVGFAAAWAGAAVAAGAAAGADVGPLAGGAGVLHAVPARSTSPTLTRSVERPAVETDCRSMRASYTPFSKEGREAPTDPAVERGC